MEYEVGKKYKAKVVESFEHPELNGKNHIFKYSSYVFWSEENIKSNNNDDIWAMSGDRLSDITPYEESAQPESIIGALYRLWDDDPESYIDTNLTDYDKESEYPFTGGCNEFYFRNGRPLTRSEIIEYLDKAPNEEYKIEKIEDIFKVNGQGDTFASGGFIESKIDQSEYIALPASRTIKVTFPEGSSEDVTNLLEVLNNALDETKETKILENKLGSQIVINKQRTTEILNDEDD